MIDVVLAAHNGERHLEALLQSIDDQTTPPAKLVVIDDCSTDATHEHVLAFAARVEFDVDIVTTECNIGSAAAFAMGVELASSAVVAFCDQDDRWHPHKLTRIERAWREAPGATMIVSDVSLADEDLRPLGQTFWQAARFESPNAGASRRDVFNALVRGGRVPGMAMTVKRDLALMAGPPLHDWHHDGWYSLIAAATGSVRFLREPLVDYRHHPDQQTAPRSRPSSRIPRDERARRFAAGAARFAILSDRLAELDVEEWAVQSTREKSSFLRARADMARKPISRPGRILSGVRTGQYARYARGAGAVADLFGLSRPRPYVG